MILINNISSAHTMCAHTMCTIQLIPKSTKKFLNAKKFEKESRKTHRI